jgi:hypothetical protein
MVAEKRFAMSPMNRPRRCIASGQLRNQASFLSDRSGAPDRRLEWFADGFADPKPSRLSHLDRRRVATGLKRRIAKTRAGHRDGASQIAERRRIRFWRIRKSAMPILG